MQLAERFVISVLVPDRIGLLRDLTGAVADMGANIDAIDQTVVEGVFAGLLTTTFPGPVAATDLAQAIRARFAPGEADVTIRAMTLPPTPPAVDCERFVVTAAGRDQPGILKAIMQFLAQHQINVESWTVLRDGAGITYVGEVAVPVQLDIRRLQTGLQAVVAPFELTAGMHHENIFRATNEIGAINALLGSRRTATGGPPPHAAGT